VKFRTAVQLSLAILIVLIFTSTLIDISFAQGNSNIDNNLPNNTSISSGPYVLQGTSDDGAFKVMIDWKKNDNINKENTFDLTFIESKSGVHIENIIYDIMLFKDDKHITESHRSAQTAKQQKFVFADQGSYTLRIENINKTGAGINIPIQVTPEFPFSILAIMTILFSTIVIATRSKFFRSGK
jgi:hypothetical protein